MRPKSMLLILCAAATVTANATPFWGAQQSSPVDTPHDALAPGEFIWEGDMEPDGPVVVMVDLGEQRAHVYRNGVRIGVSTVSSGKQGHETPTGVFTILNKDKDHRSNIYNNAAMPYSERLTWGGVALHAGGLPGYPSSHGCVHLPSEFARLLFDITHVGTTVVISGAPSEPLQMAHPSVLIPIDAGTGAEIPAHPLAPADAYRWEPERSSHGPVTLVVSASDERMVVLRNGIEIGRSRVWIRDPARPVGTHAWTLLGTDKNGDSQWHAIGMPGHAEESEGEHDEDALARIALPPQLVAQVNRVLGPGATMMLTDAPILHHTTGSQVLVMGSGLPPGAPAAAGGVPAPD